MTGSVRISSIIAALDELLEPAAFADLGPNGLQVPGAEAARRVVTGVSAQRELIERAVELDAQLVLVHHGLFWDFHPTGLTPVLAGGCGRCSSTTSRSPPTTSRSTRTPRSATTRSWPPRWAASATRRSASSAAARSGVPGRSPATASRPRSCSRACAR